MISAVSWIPKGVAKGMPEYLLNEDDEDEVPAEGEHSHRRQPSHSSWYARLRAVCRARYIRDVF